MTLPLPDDQSDPLPYPDLLDQSRRGDRDAFAQLYAATYRRVFAYLLARVGEQASAEDLLQDVYLAALDAIARFRGRTEGEFLGWLLKIAHAKVADRLRRQYRRPELHLAELPSPHRVDPLDTFDQHLRLDEIAQALAELTEDQRNVVVNRLVVGLDLDETSKLMGKNVGSIKALQHRALASLARILLARRSSND
jgi:RNA polymerase sigma-70 factor (ECF subfamily)